MPTPNKSILAGFNLNSVLLLVVIILLAVLAFKPTPSLKPPKQTTPQPVAVVQAPA